VSTVLHGAKLKLGTLLALTENVMVFFAVRMLKLMAKYHFANGHDDNSWKKHN
jgi:hypothetical protein